MRLISYALFISCLLAGCGKKSKLDESTTQQLDSLTQDGEKSKIAKTIVNVTPILVNKVAAYFSSTAKMDTFLLEARGETLKDSNVKFIIISYEGKTIYETYFGMMHAFGSGDDETSQDTSVLRLKSRFESFFDKERFSIPAIGEDWTYDSLSSQIPRLEWEEVKRDSTATSFSFVLGYDAVLHLTYSREKRRAILFAISG